ncbi:hypothetical protein L204_100087 [Cryptococcus depauperatus]
MTKLVWLLQQLIPPLFLAYFYKTWTICTFEIAPYLITNGHAVFGHIYSISPTVSIGMISLLYLRLYFLPSSQSVPPFNAPSSIQSKKVIFECLDPEETRKQRLSNGLTAEEADKLTNEPLVNRCHKGKCRGRWKPARARHCSQCEVCRAGFDHHCALFANCLTAPYMPAFLALLLYAPLVVLFHCIPLVAPLTTKAASAYHQSCTSQWIRDNWWDWRWSWVVAGGPVGRYVGGLILGWKELDRMEEGGLERLAIGLLTAFGIIVSLIAAALAHSTLAVLREGNLTVDRERQKSFIRLSRQLASLSKTNSDQNFQDNLVQRLQDLYPSRHFYIPNPTGSGKIVQLPYIFNPYRLETDPMEVILGKGWNWILPWRALQSGIGDQIFNWPLSDEAVKLLKNQTN